MAKSKSKNDKKVISRKKNNSATKKSTKTVSTNRKPRQVKKKLEVVDEVKKVEIQETELIKKPGRKSNTSTRSINRKNSGIKKEEKKELTPQEIVEQRKERNRRKYQNQQKKYQETKKTKEKKRIEVEDQVENIIQKSNNVKEDIVNTIEEKEESLVSNDIVEKKSEENLISKETKEEKESREKRKEKRKPIQFTQTLTSIKEKGTTTIHGVKEKVNDNSIPVGKSKAEKKKRSKRIIKESIVYAIILTIINVGCILVFNEFNFLRLFDIKTLNIVVTVLISLIFNFFVAFMIDFFVTGIWLKKKRKKKDGEQDGNNRINEGEYQEDIEDKEGE